MPGCQATQPGIFCAILSRVVDVAVCHKDVRQRPARDLPSQRPPQSRRTPGPEKNAA